MATVQRLAVVNGPSKWDLMLALFDVTFQHQREIKFSLQNTTHLPEDQLDNCDILVGIKELERLDSSGESWNFVGWTVYEGLIRRVSGFFRTDTRHGWFMITFE